MNKNEVLIVCALAIETNDQLNDFSVLYTGIGKVNAAVKLTQYLELLKFKQMAPQLIINYGTAGSASLKTGELVDCTKFIQRDMDAVGLGFKEYQTPFEDDVPIVLDYSFVQFNPLGYKNTCSSGDSFVSNKLNYSGDVVDMEAYALAKVCYFYQVPFISFKYITDGADEGASTDWNTNLPKGVALFKKNICAHLQ